MLARTVALALLTALFATTAHAGGGTLTLYFRGGGPIKATYTENIARPSRKVLEPDSAWFRHLSIAFDRARKPASIEPPGPGCLAFADRPLRPDEPSTVFGTWSERVPPSVKHKTTPGEWISGLNITPSRISISGVRGNGLKFLLDGLYGANVVSTVEAKIETRGKSKVWVVKAIGKHLPLKPWPPSTMLPDLRIKAIKRITKKPKVGKPILFDVSFQNVGASLAPQSSFGLRIGGSPTLNRYPLARLGVNQVWTRRLTLPAINRKGKYGITVIANPDGRLREATTKNNTAQASFKVE